MHCKHKVYQAIRVFIAFLKIAIKLLVLDGYGLTDRINSKFSADQYENCYFFLICSGIDIFVWQNSILGTEPWEVLKL
jgi:hypothetical protein